MTSVGLGLLRVSCALLMAVPGAAHAQGSAPFTYQDSFELKSVDDVQVSADGRTIAYVASDIDIMSDGRRRSIRLVEVRTKRERMFAQVGTTPRWSPDGRRIAYVGVDPDGGPAIVIADAADAERRVLVGVPSAPRELRWSPDGRSIALVMSVAQTRAEQGEPVVRPAGARWSVPPRIVSEPAYLPDGQASRQRSDAQIFVMPGSGGTPRQITFGHADVEGSPAWTPGGDALVFSSRRGDVLTRSYATARLYRVSVAGGELTPLTPPRLGAREPAISPRDGSIAFVAVEQHGRDYEPSGLYVMQADGSAPERVDGTLDREVGQPSWTGDGRALYASYADAGIGKIARFDRQGRWQVAADHVAGGGYTLGRGDAVAFASERSDRPGGVALKVGRHAVMQLTDRNAALLSNRVIATVRPLAVRSSLDGADVGAWLTTPPRSGDRPRLPLILSIHGGPYGHDGPGWRTVDQLYAAAGYAVLHVNYRGSTSYGFAFADRISKDFPGPAYADLMSAVDAAVAVGVVDPDRLFVTGGSAGGQLTAWIVGSTDRFRAAAAEKPVINAISHALSSDQYLVNWQAYGGPAWQLHERYWASSALSRVGQVRTPTMLIVGEDDRRTPLTEAQQFYHALTLRRVPTALVIFPGASHASLGARPAQLVREVDLVLAWFGRFGGIADPARDGRYHWRSDR